MKKLKNCAMPSIPHKDFQPIAKKAALWLAHRNDIAPWFD
jgi:hypothetical protein